MGAAPSRESETLFSYFRGSYEVGLIPLTKRYFGAEESNNEGGAAAEKNKEKEGYVPKNPILCPEYHVNRPLLREQIVAMRRDPAVLYANARDRENMLRSLKKHLSAAEEEEKEKNKMAEESKEETQNEEAKEQKRKVPGDEELERLLRDLYWDVMPQPNFTEKNLDNFLDIVEKYLYDSDAAMANDPTYVVLNKSKDDVSKPNEAENNVPFFMPIPCALCLAYPEGKEREGCFEMEGRNINIIGYFGLMTEEMERAFCIHKYDKDNECVQADVASQTERNVEYMEEEEEEIKDQDAFKPQGTSKLFLNTVILTSAGDRTLERVLVLAAVMLRHQFHVSCRKAGIVKKIHDMKQKSNLWRDDFLKNIESYLPHVVKASALPPLPAESYVPHPCNFMNENSVYPPTHLRLLPSQSTLRMSKDNLAESALTTSNESHADISEYLNSLASNASTATPNFISYTPAVPSPFCLTNEEENRINWGLLQRLDTIAVVIETASNNYSSLKALTENFAFLHCQVLLDPSLSHVHFVSLPKKTAVANTSKPPLRSGKDGKSETEGEEKKASKEGEEGEDASKEKKKEATLESKDAVEAKDKDAAAKKTSDNKEKDVSSEPATTNAEEESKENKPHVVLSPSSAIVITLQPVYFRQATLWAASLFHFPTPLQGGNWIQYKLKDESEDLRQILQNKDSLISRWRHQEVERSSKYLGPSTSRLLKHVCALQEETEHARTLPPQSWGPRSIYVNADSRKYAVHASPYGTLLVGVRAPHAAREHGEGGNGNSGGNKGGDHHRRNMGGRMSKKNSVENRMADMVFPPPGGMPFLPGNMAGGVPMMNPFGAAGTNPMNMNNNFNARGSNNNIRDMSNSNINGMLSNNGGNMNFQTQMHFQVPMFNNGGMTNGTNTTNNMNNANFMFGGIPFAMNGNMNRNMSGDNMNAFLGVNGSPMNMDMNMNNNANNFMGMGANMNAFTPQQMAMFQAMSNMNFGANNNNNNNTANLLNPGNQMFMSPQQQQQYLAMLVMAQQQQQQQSSPSQTSFPFNNMSSAQGFTPNMGNNMNLNSNTNNNNMFVPHSGGTQAQTNSMNKNNHHNQSKSNMNASNPALAANMGNSPQTGTFSPYGSADSIWAPTAGQQDPVSLSAFGLTNVPTATSNLRSVDSLNHMDATPNFNSNVNTMNSVVPGVTSNAAASAINVGSMQNANLNVFQHNGSLYTVINGVPVLLQPTPLTSLPTAVSPPLSTGTRSELAASEAQSSSYNNNNHHHTNNSTSYTINHSSNTTSNFRGKHSPSILEDKSPSTSSAHSSLSSLPSNSKSISSKNAANLGTFVFQP